MKQTLNKYIREANSFRIQGKFGINDPNTNRADCIINQDKFYITLFCDIFNKIDNLEKVTEQKKNRLISKATALLIFCEKETETQFRGIDKDECIIIASAVLYLCGMKAVAKEALQKRVLLKKMSDIENIIAFIITGERLYINRSHNEIANILKEYFAYGDDASLNEMHSMILNRLKETETDYDYISVYLLEKCYKSLYKSIIWKCIQPKVREEYSIWHNYILHLMNDDKIISLFDSQIDAINKGLLSFERGFTVQTPTSTGKTFITELVLLKELLSSGSAKVLYLAPLKLLCKEVSSRFTKLLDYYNNISLRTIYGGCDERLSDDEYINTKLIIATPESCNSYIDAGVINPSDFTLVICDEGDILCDKERGTIYELIISRLKAINTIRFLFISAIISGCDKLSNWIGASPDDVVTSFYQPTRRILSVYDINDGNYKVYKDNYKSPLLITNKLLGENGVFSSIIDASAALACHFKNAGPVVVYTNYVNGNSGCLNYLKHIVEHITQAKSDPSLISMPRISEKLRYAIEYCSSVLGPNDILVKALQYKVGCHYGILPSDIRSLIEDLYSNNELSILVCTGTISAGVNLPIKTLILGNISSTVTVGQLIDNAHLNNLLGRVGRAGNIPEGLIVVPDSSAGGRINMHRTLRHVRNSLKLRNTVFLPIESWVSAYLSENNLLNATTDEDLCSLLSVETIYQLVSGLIAHYAIMALDNQDDFDSFVESTFSYSFASDGAKPVLKRLFHYAHANINFSDFGLQTFPVIFDDELDALKTFFDKILEENNYDLSELQPETALELSLDSIIHIDRLRDKLYNSLNTIKIESDKLLAISTAWLDGCLYEEVSQRFSLPVLSTFKFISFFENQLVPLIRKTFEIFQTRLTSEFSCGPNYNFLSLLSSGYLVNWKCELSKCGFSRLEIAMVSDIVRTYGLCPDNHYFLLRYINDNHAFIEHPSKFSDRLFDALVVKIANKHY